MTDNSLVISVSQLNFYLKSLLDGDSHLSGIFISGEISNLKHHYSSGHIYFTLKDDRSAIPAVMFKWNASNLAFDLKEGTRVICHSKVSLYDKDTKVQLYVESIQPFGIGSAYLSFEHLKEKLEKKGYFAEERKKKLPAFPKKVAVLTSESGSVFRDIINVTSRRYPLCTVCLVPIPVQGNGAENTISQMLKICDKTGVFDVIIIARGGGSLEDLSPFNSEILADAVYLCSTPVVSAVGHETDYTICDFVSDLRAPTPSAAVELVFKDVYDISTNLEQYRSYIVSLFCAAVEKKRISLNNLMSNTFLNDPMHIFIKKLQRLENDKQKLFQNFTRKYDKSSEKLKNAVVRLNYINPLSLLSRGYTITKKDNSAVHSIDGLMSGDRIKVLFFNGTADCNVIKTENFNEK